jgi:hypothetical protein
MTQARLLSRIRREFQEHPGIALTLPQARRLWSLEEPAGTDAFNTLIDEGFLQRVDDVYLWAEAPVPRFRPRRNTRPVLESLARR